MGGGAGQSCGASPERRLEAHASGLKLRARDFRHIPLNSSLHPSCWAESFLKLGKKNKRPDSAGAQRQEREVLSDIPSPASNGKLIYRL